ncbi:MAG: class I SAM-dependent methyltransferase family protein [Methanosarcinales archaeon]|nr:class I SAM-dependent methyltransferase family protein [Methanosarcinales archaeon]
MNEMKALVVPKEQAEAVRLRLLEQGCLDTKRKLSKRGKHLEIPITGAVPSEFKSYPVVWPDDAKYYEPEPTLRDLMKEHLDNDKLALLPGGWQMIGDIVVISLHSDLYPERKQVGDAMFKLYPNCKSVYLDEGISGKLRRPRRELVAVRDGVNDPAITVHNENGCRFRLDVTKVMFSKGNLQEKMRMSRLGKGEVVVDMFAGIGYFTIPIAVHSRPDKIIAIEINPESYHYLVENIRLNGVEGIVDPILGDCAEMTPVLSADRVIMGYVGNTSHYLKYGIKALKSGGILHYHDTVPVHLVPSRPTGQIRDEACKQGRRAEILDWHRIKKYSPGVWHVVVDARIT